ncbi:MAG TPA: MarR family winged helix-turn-helix transcriptional regulator [Streptosporangiaceae bacterium]|nr:MarR family winged helix-turn-helix transcriptional regulator [Streptosporangiaceae bacterium]
MDDEGAIRLRVVISKLARELNASSTGEGLTPSQASVLSLIVARGPLGLTELGERERINPTMLSRVIGRLVEMELITRTPDPTDLRSVSVLSTAAGRRIDKKIKARRAVAVSECLELLPAEQVAALTEALPVLENLAETMRQHGGGARGVVPPDQHGGGARGVVSPGEHSQVGT